VRSETKIKLSGHLRTRGAGSCGEKVDTHGESGGANRPTENGKQWQEGAGE